MAFYIKFHHTQTDLEVQKRYLGVSTEGTAFKADGQSQVSFKSAT